MTYKVEYPGQIAFMINNGIVKQGEGILRRVIICRAPSKGGYIDFCDGDDWKAPGLMTLTLDLTESISIQPISLECGFKFQHGLYVFFGGGITNAEIAVIYN